MDRQRCCRTAPRRCSGALVPSAPGRVDVTASGRAGRCRPGVEAHSAATLDPRDVTTVDGIPCTTVARTLLDIAHLLDARSIERACERAETLGLFDARAVEATVERAGGRAGAPALAAALTAWRPEVALVRSELERRFLGLCAAARIPRREPNAWIPLPDGGLEVDFLWRAQRVVAETDSHRFHGTRPAFERDRRRDQRLLIADFTVARFTWRQVVDEPADVAATLAGMLAGRLRRAPPGS